MAQLNASAAEVPGASVSVGTSSTPVVAARSGRDVLIIVNDSDIGVYLRLASSGAVVGEGIYLKADGGAWEFEGWTGPVCAIVETGTANLCVVEV